jgi:predicted Holliday junction resolvase-like endonuclease
MDILQLIDNLQRSGLYATCCHCEGKFKLSKAIMFDGLGKLPSLVEDKRKEMNAEFKQMVEDFKKRRLSALVGAEKKSIEVGIGKNIEKVVPTLKEFKFPLCDCRPLFDPIDMIIFEGVTKMKVESIKFMEIKTGNAKLNEHQRAIKDAISDEKVSFMVL